MEDDSFHQCFAPLAHHLYPDGSPVDGRSPNINENEYWKEHHELLLIGWPKRVDRRITSYQDALKSIKNVHQFAKQSGLSKEQMVAVATAAYATLPLKAIEASGNRILMPAVGAGSKLIDGSSYPFITLVKSLIPRHNKPHIHVIPGCIIAMLLSCCTSSHTPTEIKIILLRFFNLTFRAGNPHSNGMIGHKKYPSGSEIILKLYAIPFSMLSNSAFVKDAVQLLYLITQRYHVTKYRIDILHSLYNKSFADPNSNDFTFIRILINLFAQYHPDLNSKNSISNFKRNDASMFLRFPDETWMIDFNGISENKDSFVQNEDSRKTDKYINEISKGKPHVDINGFDESSNFVPNNEKGLNSFANFIAPSSHKYLNIKYHSQKQVIMDSGPRDLRTKLPFALHDEWYNNNTRVNRLHILRALKQFATEADGLSPESEQFLLDIVLPSWDGDAIITDVLCRDLLSVLSPPVTNFDVFKRRLLSPLSKIYIGGSARIKFTIVSGLLSSLILRWGRINWNKCDSKNNSFSKSRYNHTNSSSTSRTSSKNSFFKYHILKELVNWTDKLLITGLIIESGMTGGTLVRLSAWDFYNAVCELSPSFVAITTPSPQLLYRILLSEEALSVENVCGLLLKYKTILEKWKQQRLSESFLGRNEINRNNNESKEGIVIPQGYGFERVALFNCFIWDFCSVLWRSTPLHGYQSECEIRKGPEIVHEHSILFSDISEKKLDQLQSLPLELKLSSALSITHGATFSGFVSSFLQNNCESSKSGAPSISPNLLTGKLKVKYLDYLKGLGFKNLFLFLTTFVGSLAEREMRKKRKLENKC